MSRLRGASAAAKDDAGATYARDRHRDQEASARTCRTNGATRYHFGMTGQTDEEGGRNGRDWDGEPSRQDPDLLYRKSKEQFASWDIRDIVRDEDHGARRTAERFEHSRLTNGRSRTDDSARQDRCKEHEEEEEEEVEDEEEKSSSRNGATRTGSSDRDRHRAGSMDRAGGGRWRRKDDPEASKGPAKFARSRNEGRELPPQRCDEREQLLREIECLAVDGRSPDRRIRAMIERFKWREEEKLMRTKRKGRKEERDSLSPEMDEHGSKFRPESCADRDRCKVTSKDERDEERGSSRSGRRDLGETGRSRSADKRGDAFAVEKRNDHASDKGPRRSGETEDPDPDPGPGPGRIGRKDRDSPRRRSYVYEGNPEDFHVRIQRYERAFPEPRRDPESTRRVPLKDPDDADSGRRDSLRDHDRRVSLKNSVRSGDAKRSPSTRVDGESSLARKASTKDQENGVPVPGRSASKCQDLDRKYFGRDPGRVDRRSSFKEQDRDASRKNSDYGRIALTRSRRDDDDEDAVEEEEEERRRPVKGHATDGVSRITFGERDPDAVPARIQPRRGHPRDADVGRVGCKERRNSLKEKSVDFAGISCEDPSVPRPEDSELVRGSFLSHAESSPRKRASPNGRFVEFGGVSFHDDDDDDDNEDNRDEEAVPRLSPSRDQDYELERKSAARDRDCSWSRRRGDCSSSRSKSQEEKRQTAGRHSRPLSPPKAEERRGEDREEFDAKSWHERNRAFAARYLRENARFRANPEGRSEIERDPSPEMRIRERYPNEGLEEEGAGNPDNGHASAQERNGATIIRIRGTGAERRRRRRPGTQGTGHRGRRYREDSDVDEDEEEEEDGFPAGRGVSTPSRTVWNYREGGVLITDVEEGQPCLQCGDTCAGFSPHTWRKNCTSCKCPREAHEVCHEEWVSVRSRLGLKGEESTCPASFDPRSKGLAWAPPGLPAHKVEEYFSMLPEISVPRLGTPAERYRDRQLAIQLPKQDLARAYCRHLNPEHAVSADDFMAARNEIALDIGSVQEVLERDVTCGSCLAPLKYASLAVSASKLGHLYHPACFRCTECKELLVDLAYCVHDDTLFCERHYAEQLKPRCAACDELIFSGEYTKAMNKDWHSGHFCCWQCDESLTGQRYVLRDEHPYCIKCYESVFANGCEECNKIIGIDSKDLSYKDKHWHEACFLCNRCRVSLVDKQFGSKVDKIYCGNCYDAQFASRCDGCGEIFRAGTKKMEYKTRQWHEKCFCCVVCKNPIGTKSFIPREQEIYCAGCYEDKFATRCVKCNKIITSGGVTYKNEPWHRDCFTCSNCNNSLAGQRFTSRDDKPYCADCFGELFAKRCTACSKPITGIGGTRFISFEDRHWHNDCFICAGCKTSLVGRGFITDAEDIICPDCAKMKLM